MVIILIAGIGLDHVSQKKLHDDFSRKLGVLYNAYIYSGYRN